MNWRLCDNPEMPLGHCHRDSQPVERRVALVCVFSPRCGLVSIKATEEFAFCSAHLPGWVDDIQFEQPIEEVLEADRSKASGSVILGIDANCNVDDNDDQGLAGQGLVHLAGLATSLRAGLDICFATSGWRYEEEESWLPLHRPLDGVCLDC